MSSVASRAVRNSTGTLSRPERMRRHDLEAVEVGQHHVEEDEVGRELPHARRDPSRPLAAAVTSKPKWRSADVEQEGDVLLVVDHQDPGRPLQRPFRSYAENRPECWSPLGARSETRRPELREAALYLVPARAREPSAPIRASPATVRGATTRGTTTPRFSPAPRASRSRFSRPRPRSSRHGTGSCWRVSRQQPPSAPRKGSLGRQHARQQVIRDLFELRPRVPRGEEADGMHVQQIDDQFLQWPVHRA